MMDDVIGHGDRTNGPCTQSKLCTEIEVLLSKHNACFLQRLDAHMVRFDKLFDLAASPETALLEHDEVAISNSVESAERSRENGAAECQISPMGSDSVSMLGSTTKDPHRQQTPASSVALRPSLTVYSLNSSLGGSAFSHDLQEEDKQRWMAARYGAGTSEMHSSGSAYDGMGRCHRTIARCVNRPSFEIVMAVLIISNSVLIGVETQYQSTHRLDVSPSGFKVMGYVYTSLFAIEWLLRFMAERCSFFTGANCSWNRVDTVIVACSVFEVLVDILNLDSDFQNASIARIVRIIRTVRLSRALRLASVIRFVSALQTLVYSIVATVKSLVWALVLLFMIVYVCGIAFTQATNNYIVNHHDEDDEILVMFWGSLVSSMITLYKSVIGGISWHEVTQPLRQIHWSLEGFFIAYVSFTVLAVLNVVTGVFCNSAIETARREPEMVVQAMMSDYAWYENNLRKLFASLDKDNGGTITIRELEKCLSDESVMGWFRAMELEVSDAWTLFKLIDNDHSHDIAIEEFVQGCMQLRGGARNIDMAHMKNEQRSMMRKLAEMTGKIDETLMSDRKQAHADLLRIQQSLMRVIYLCANTKHELLHESEAPTDASQSNNVVAPDDAPPGVPETCSTVKLLLTAPPSTL